STGEGGSDYVSLAAFVYDCRQSEAARRLADMLGAPFQNTDSVTGTSKQKESPATTDASPKIHCWGNDGPQVWPDEARRHVYRHGDGQINKVKIKKADDGYINWYPVQGGWQAKKPDGFRPVPYVTTSINPFDPELAGDQILWPEGEK